MALFNKLFTKERCCICGAEVGAMQRKRLTDGVICKECAQSCSPWFEDYKSSSISQLKTQWKMRDANRKVLETSFVPSRRLGDYGAFIFDDTNDQFVAFAQVPDEVVKDLSVERLVKYNPDILKLGTIKSVDFRLEESEHEEKRVTKEGEKVSYDPPRYRYGYNWVITLAMDNAPTVGVPYVKRVRVRLNRMPVHVRCEGKRITNDVLKSRGTLPAEWASYRPPVTQDYDLSEKRDVRNVESFFEEPPSGVGKLFRGRSATAVCDYSFGFKPSPENKDALADFAHYQQMALDTLAALGGK